MLTGHRRRPVADAGITLLEILVAIAVIGIVMTALTSFFVNSVSAASRQGGQQVAVQLADDATERLRAMKGSALTLGRDKTSSDTQWSAALTGTPPGVTPYLADMQEAWDATATSPAGATAPLPTSPKLVTVNGLAYRQYWYVGNCWQPAAGGDCAATQTSGYVPYFRVVVAVTWAERHCAGNTCSYTTSTLVSNAASDPIFNANETARAPTVTNPGSQTGEVTVPELLQVTAAGGAPPLTWSASGLPDGLLISSSGLISGSPTAPCTCSVIVRVTDGFGLVGSAAFTWTVAPLPVLTNPGAQTSQSGVAVSVPLAVTGGTAPYAWAVAAPGLWGATGLPPGLSINASTGVISGTPTTTGAADVTVSVTDSLGKASSATFTWTVVNTTYKGLVLGDGARGYWRLGESSGTTAVDETGASNGTYAGGFTLGASGALVNDPNTAVDLSGSSGRVSIPSVPALDLTSRVSIEAWVRPDSLAGTRWIVNKGTFYFLYISDGITYFGVNAGGPYLYVTTTQVTAGAWQHLVGTYDGSRLVLYRNGAEVASTPATGAISSTTAPVFIGAVDATGAFFDGGIDEVAIYGSALSGAQVGAHYDRGNGTRPDLAITFPNAGEIYGTSSWNAGCSSAICGTAGDTGGGVASVAVSIRQGTGNYWNGSAFASATEVLLPATGTTSWTYSFAGASFPADGPYTVRAVAADAAGTTANASITFTINKTAPTVAITFPASGGTYNTTTWNAGCSSRICGTAAAASGSIASVAVSIRQGGGNYWNGTAFASATEVLLPATGTTSWTYSFAGTSFPAEGAYTVRAVATDTAGNKASTSRSFTIDRTGPAPTALTLFNADGEVTPRTDQVRIMFSDALDTSSICSAWSGTGDQALSGNGVVVTITNNGSNDILTVTSSGCTLHIGSIATGNDYVSSTATFSGSGNNQSRVTWKASSRLLTISIGRQTSGTLNTGRSAATAVYTPDAAIKDVAGNAITTTPFSSAAQRF